MIILTTKDGRDVPAKLNNYIEHNIGFEEIPQFTRKYFSHLRYEMTSLALDMICSVIENGIIQPKNLRQLKRAIRCRKL